MNLTQLYILDAVASSESLLQAAVKLHKTQPALSMALKKLEQEGVPVYPQPHIIELIQDKGLQKQFYKEHGIPTAPFVLVDCGVAPFPNSCHAIMLLQI